MPLETWFPAFVYFEDLEVPPAAREPALAAAREALAAGAEPAHSLHLDPRLDALLALFGPPIRRLLFDELRLEQAALEISIGRCWPVAAGGLRSSESEPDAGGCFSGVFFLDAPDGSGELEIQKSPRAPYDGLPRREAAALTFTSTRYAAVPHRLLLFDSQLAHRLLPNRPAAGGRLALLFRLYAVAAAPGSGTALPNPRSRLRIGAELPVDGRGPRRAAAGTA